MYKFSMALRPKIRNVDIVMLDLCSISALKNKNNSSLSDDKKEHISKLETKLKSGYQFSLLLAIIERLTNPREKLSFDELKNTFIRDHQLITKLFGQCILESEDDISKAIDAFALEAVNIPKNQRGELKYQERINLLNYCNNDMNLYNKTAPKKMLDMSCRIVKKAKEFNLEITDPTIAIILSSIYGSEVSSKILKFREKNFDPDNALADILVNSRFATAQEKLRKNFIEGKCEYYSADKSLEHWVENIQMTANGKNLTWTIIPAGQSIFFPKVSDEAYKDILTMLGAQWN